MRCLYCYRHFHLANRDLLGQVGELDHGLWGDTTGVGAQEIEKLNTHDMFSNRTVAERCALNTEHTSHQAAVCIDKVVNHLHSLQGGGERSTVGNCLEPIGRRSRNV